MVQVKMRENLKAGLELFDNLHSATKTDMADDLSTLKSIQSQYIEITNERNKQIEASREASKNLIKKADQAKISSVRPSYQSSEMVSNRMADLESEKFRIAKAITEWEQTIASLEREIYHLKERNEILERESNAFEQKYHLIHRLNMYGHLGFEAIADPNVPMVFEKVRIKCSHLNDVYTVPLEQEKYNRFENANRLWDILRKGQK